MADEKQREWPLVKRNPTAWFQSPDVVQRSDRGVAGPLRMGTTRGVGPSGALLDGPSDFEMDRVTPRNFDPMGTSNSRSPDFPGSQLVSREARRERPSDPD